MPVDDVSLTLTVNVTGDCLSQWHGGLLKREKKVNGNTSVGAIQGETQLSRTSIKE